MPEIEIYTKKSLIESNCFSSLESQKRYFDILDKANDVAIGLVAYGGSGWPLMVYPFHDAPTALKAVSLNGGDEDWLLVIFQNYKDLYIGWSESSWFGCSDISDYVLECGVVIRIGSHA